MNIDTIYRFFHQPTLHPMVAVGELSRADLSLFENLDFGMYCVILLGAKSNPHFYIKQADLLVSLSSSEACPRVIIEALILGPPVLSSNFPSIYEYLDDGLYGRIAPIENFPDAIAQLLTDKPLYNRLKNNLKNYSFDNTSLIKQLEAIF